MYAVRNLSYDDAKRIIANHGMFKAAVRTMIATVINDVRGQMLDVIVRRVKVNRNRTRQQVLDAMSRHQFVDDVDALALMPTEGDETVEMTYFNLGYFCTHAELDAEYEARGLEPDPVAQAADNEYDPEFGDDHPNGTHWKLPDRDWGFIEFCLWRIGRGVSVHSHSNGWNKDWWFGGRRKKVLGS